MEDTVDVATQWVEEMEAGSQTDSVLNSSTQTIDDLSGQEEKGEEEEEEEEEGDMVNSSCQTLRTASELEIEEMEEEGTQTLLPDSVTLALAILANRLPFCFNQSKKEKQIIDGYFEMKMVAGCCTGSTPS